MMAFKTGHKFPLLAVAGLLGAFLTVLTAGCGDLAYSWPLEAGDKVAVQTIALESANQPLLGQIAVGEVIRNRMRERHQTAEQVCLAPYQFSCHNDRAHARKRLAKTPAWMLDRAAMVWSMSGEAHAAVVDQANLYKTKQANPAWARSSKVKYIKTIADHQFYKEIR